MKTVYANFEKEVKKIGKDLGQVPEFVDIDFDYLFDQLDTKEMIKYFEKKIKGYFVNLGK